MNSVIIWKVIESDGGDNKLEKVINLNIVGCIDYVISPKAGYLATYEKLASSNSDSNQFLNYSIWKLNFKEGKAEKKISFSHKNQSTWTPQWTLDDSLMGRMVNGEVQFFKREEIDDGKVFPSFRIILDSLNNFSICPSARDFKCAVFAKESNGRPGCVRIYSIFNNEIEGAINGVI